jgi:type I site-specific restriction-modification system R (restriction) subunit
MLFAVQKLKNVGLNNPTILIVIDRRDLDDQINETFTACSSRVSRQPDSPSTEHGQCERRAGDH